METERIGDAAVLRAGVGEWYNQPGRGLWDMGEDAADIPAAKWHQEVQAAIRSLDWHASMVVIDATAMTYLVGQDYGFLLKLSDQLKRAGIMLKVIAPLNEVRVYAILPHTVHERLQMVATLGEALQGR